MALEGGEMRFDIEVIRPPVLHNSIGEERTVGLELEFCGPVLEEITRAIRLCYGGEINYISEYETKVVNTRYGDFIAELDASLFREMKIRKYFKKLGLNDVRPGLADSIEEILASAAGKVVPYEIVFPPVAISQIGEMEELRKIIFSKGAQGTGASIFNAFGFHMNPELPQTDPPTVLAYLRAFFILFDSLKKGLKIDLTREITPFIDPFPDRYIKKVLNSGYQPDTAQLIEDYIADNPTRNRPLDLLPVFAWMDEERIHTALPDQKISRRPTLHYRLPNSRIDEEDWSFTGEWNNWVPVEILANDPPKLKYLAEKYLYRLEHPVLSTTKDWIEEIKDVFR
jgi:hypothetical protein